MNLNYAERLADLHMKAQALDQYRDKLIKEHRDRENDFYAKAHSLIWEEIRKIQIDHGL